MKNELDTRLANREESLATPAHKLVSWYRKHRRILPWRQTSDPYSIWISETMLQQTRVDTVIPYYNRFMEAFPTVTALASAEEDVVVKLWQGLGYYSRVRNLHKAAKLVVDKYQGRIPTDEAGLATLPGIGPYTKGAILSIAFGQPYPAVDGNVLRVMSRVLANHQPIQSKALKDAVFDEVLEWMEGVPPADLSQALMELGALVCTPRNTDCANCPIVEDCRAHRLGVVESLPVRRPKAARRMVDVVSLWLETDDGLLMQQRPSEGLLAGLWQLPSVEIERNQRDDPLPEDEQRQRAGLLYSQLTVASQEGVGVKEAEMEFAPIATERHIFSHVEWYVTVWRPIATDGYPVKSSGVHPEQTSCHYVAPAGLDRLALPRVYEKLMQSILNKKG